MTKEELEALKKTFPWRFTTFMGKLGCQIQIVDKNGREVDLMQLVKFVCFISEKLSKP